MEEDEELIFIFENHKCTNDSSCEICIQYMERFNPDRLIELGIDEDPMVNEI